MTELLAGAVAFGYFVGGLFFLRFWRRSRDRLFLAFATAFWLFAANQALAVLFSIDADSRPEFYLLRLLGFALIIAAIVGKNLPRRR